ncbi:MAG TPA: hypothetical protein H9898_03245, partial [Candidatus Anaerobiospirillum stercoravium]|nr:hypothetical protein [Candidatus Anaerobiospirillum stercoravium]
TALHCKEKGRPRKVHNRYYTLQWWEHRQELKDETGLYKAKCFSRSEIEALDYNLDLCGYPQEQEDELLPPDELIAHYQAQRAQLSAQIDATLSQIMALVGRAQS